MREFDMSPASKKKSKPRRRRKPFTAVSASATNSLDEGYRVGPGHPPKQYQFKPGQSGNPRGAKRKPKLAPDLRALLEHALNEEVKLRRGERDQIIPKVAAGFIKLADQFAEGNHNARRDLFAIAEKLGINRTASQGKDRHVDVSNEAEFWQAVRDRGIPLRLLPPIDEAGAEPPPDPPLPPDEDESER
jgi:hypothetical protein